MSTGTGGTLAGISTFLKEQNHRIRTVLADPPVHQIICSLNEEYGFICLSKGKRFVQLHKKW